MKIFAIRSDSVKPVKDAAYLIYYEKSKKFYIEIPDDANEWEIPLVLSSCLKKGEKTVNSYYSELWVQQRIVPPDRQNLGQILKENNLDSYDEFELLMLSKGRCSQDDYYLVSITADKLPKDFEVRFSRRIEDVIPLKNNFLLVFFRNGDIKKCNITEFMEKSNCKGILSKYENFRTVEILTDGHGIGFGSLLSVSSEKLYSIGVSVALTAEDFRCFASNRVISVSEACKILGCSRQNINDLIKRGKLNPISPEGENIMLMKNEVLERKRK
jgi:excisionase family DNA binding protein